MSAEWMDRAQCLGVEMQPDAATAAEVAELAAVCAGCPVRRECHQLAAEQFPSAYGVHAGRWWGEPPREPLLVRCTWCGEGMDAERSTAAYCGSRCRVAAYRARQAVSA